MSFENKVVIVTGGGTGIGKAAASRFIQEGAKVVINGRRENVLEETAKELDPSGENIVCVAGDISVKSTANTLVKKAVDTFGGVDILICNSGIFNPTGFLEHDESDLDNYLDVIVKGTFYPSQAVIPEMKKKGRRSYC